MQDSPTALFLKASHSPSRVTITRKEPYGSGMLVFFYITTGPGHPIPNQERSRVAYFDGAGESRWDMEAS